MPKRHLLVQRQQLKHQANVWNLLKVSNKDTKVTPDLVLVSLLISSIGFDTLF